MSTTICPDCGGRKDRRSMRCLTCARETHWWSRPRRSAPRGNQTAAEVVAAAMATAYRTEQGCLIPTLRVPMNTGYVRVFADGSPVMLHRLVVGDIDPGLTVDHECHNLDLACPGGPCIHRRCIEPSHLVLRPVGENWERGRQGAVARRRALAHCPNGHPYEAANLRTGCAGRSCKACSRARQAGRDPAQEPTYLAPGHV